MAAVRSSVEQVAVSEFSGDSQQRLQHFRSDIPRRVSSHWRASVSGLFDQISFFASARHERNQLLAQQTRVVAIFRLCQPSQRQSLLAEFLANEANPLLTQVRRHAFTLEQRRNIGRGLHHVPVADLC